jgi:hypothetical protein
LLLLELIEEEPVAVGAAIHFNTAEDHSFHWRNALGHFITFFPSFLC